MVKLIEKFQKGSKINYLPDIKQDNTNVTNKIITPTVTRGSFGQPMIGKSQEESRKAYIISKGGNQSEIKPYNKSLREKALSGIHKFNDRVTGGELVSDIVAAPLRLARVDKYFDNVQNDSDIRDALFNVAGDAASVVGLGEGVGMLKKGAKKYLREIPGEKNMQRLSNRYNIDELMAMTDDDLDHLVNSSPEIGNLLHNSYDPRTRAEILVDNIHDSDAYKNISSRLNNSSRLKGLKSQYLQKKYIQDSPFTKESIEQFTNSGKRMMRDGNLIIIGRNDTAESLRRIKDSNFGDGSLAGILKQNLLGKKSPKKNQLVMLNNILDDRVRFSAYINPEKRLLSDVSFFSNSKGPITNADKIKSGRLTQELMERSPVDYTYNFGSLSGDSYPLSVNLLDKNKDRIKIVDYDLKGFNQHGSQSNLSKILDKTVKNSSLFKTDKPAYYNLLKDLTNELDPINNKAGQLLREKGFTDFNPYVATRNVQFPDITFIKTK